MSSRLAGVVLASLMFAACSSVTLGSDNQSEETVGEPERGPPSTTTVLPDPTTTTLEQTTTSPPPALDPRVEESLAIAEEFMKGFANRDMEVVAETAVEGHVFGLLVDTFDLFPAEFSWLDAVGWKMSVTGCEIANPDLDHIRVTCVVTHENAWSRALGVGPYESEFVLGVTHPDGDQGIYDIPEERDRPTVTERATIQFPAYFFKTETWGPFLTWLEAEHPDELSIMFGGVTMSEEGFLPGELLPSLLQESITLWKEYTDEYVANY